MRSPLVLLLLVVPVEARPVDEQPSFTRKPAARRHGEKAVVEFAVDRETDVAVFVETAQGKVVRHLAAGVLGKNAPAPLRQNALEQTLEWDGRADWGKPAGEGPFRFRVALGLGARFDRIVAEDAQNLGAVRAMAVAPDGTLYAVAATGAQLPNWRSERIVALDRQGKYLRTVYPFSAELKKEEVAGYGVYDLDGRPAPLVKSVPERRFHSGLSARKGGLAVAPGGILLKVTEDATLSAVGVRGDVPWGPEGGPRLTRAERLAVTRPFLCVSGDGKHAFVTGLAGRRTDGKTTSFACIYRTKLPDRGPAEPFFGKPEEPGSDDVHLSDSPRGLALDGRGNLLAADFRNDRVLVVSEADGKVVGEFRIEKPDGVAADPATGAVYVLSLTKRNGGSLIKFAGWKDPREVTRLSVPAEGNPDFPPVLALDASARPAVLWVGTDAGRLLRIEDRGQAFESSEIGSRTFGSLGFVGLEVNRFAADPEVWVRCEMGGGFAGDGTFLRYAEATGALEAVPFKGTGGVTGTCVVPAPDGIVYAPAYSHHLLRYTRDGKPAPWPPGNVGYPDAHPDKEGKIRKWTGPAHGIFAPVSMVYMTHTVGVRGTDGHIFVFEAGHPGDRPPKMLREYTPEGKRVSDEPIVWKVSDNAVGPKFDPQGNIYFAEQIKPLDQPCPTELRPVLGPVEPGKTSLEKAPLKDAICKLYGSIVKFTPKGGMIHFSGENPYKGEPKLDPTLKTEAYASYSGYRMNPVKVTGASWVRMGISHQCLHYCNCENTRFDVDEFGRVWYPDLGRFRVVVLDTNGNEIAHFGRYGNADSRGPEIGFCWLIGVGVTDRYVYAGDSLNRRLLRAKLVYAAEAVCPIP